MQSKGKLYGAVFEERDEDKIAMRTSTYNDFRQKIKDFLSAILKKPVNANFEAIDETAYLLKSPKNAERLLKGLKDYEEFKLRKMLFEE